MGKKRRSQLLLELPFTSESPTFTSAAVGLPRIIKRPATSFVMDVTIVDAADARLLRAGVTVAHRVIAGLGDWYLAAPGWEPYLPTERVEPLGANGDLPDEFGRLIRPLVRRGMLGTLAALHIERDEWALRTDDGTDAAVIRDERGTVRRSGMTTARYREVTITPAQQLSGQQREFLVSAATAVGGTVVDRFPTLRQRIGAPATGLTSFPAPSELHHDASLEEFVSTLFCQHLGSIVRADLHRRANDPDDVADVTARVWAFGRDLRGLAAVLEPAWRESTEALLRGLPFTSASEAEGPVLDVIDALVLAARAPRLGDLSHRPAAELLFQRAEQATLILADRCRSLSPDSDDGKWLGALRAAEHLELVAAVAQPLFPRTLTKLLRRLNDTIAELRECAKPAVTPELDGLSAAQAFQMGQESERKRVRISRAREEFVAGWPERVVEARRLLANMGKKMAKRA